MEGFSFLTPHNIFTVKLLKRGDIPLCLHIPLYFMWKINPVLLFFFRYFEKTYIFNSTDDFWVAEDNNHQGKKESKNVYVSYERHLNNKFLQVFVFKENFHINVIANTS